MRRVVLTLACLFLADGIEAATPVEAAQIALKDCQKLPADQQLHARYFWAPFADKDLDTFYKVLNFHIHSLSREAEFAPPVKVVADVWRIDFRDYGWQREVYEKLAAQDPYFHAKIQTVLVPAVVVPVTIAVGDTVKTVRDCNAFHKDQPARSRGEVDAGTEFKVAGIGGGDMLLVESSVGQVWVRQADVSKVGAVAQAPAVASAGKAVGEAVTASAPWLPGETMTKLIAATQSQTPLLRADWFFAQTARQVDRNNQQIVGYYDFLGIKKEADLEELAGLDRKTADRLRRELRAIIADSGVTLHNRQIAAVQDGYWESLDVDRNDGAANAVRQLDGDYKPVAKEVYFRLPNGLWGLAAVNAANGQLAASVPDSIASDNKSTSNDHRIHPGLSCIRCHAEGLRPLDDWARQFYANPPGDAKLTSYDYAKLKRLRQLYLGPLTDRYEDDQRVYARVLLRLTGWKPGEAAKAYAEAWQAYADISVSGEQMALELGVKHEVMLAAFKAYAKANGGNLDPVLLGYLKKPAFVSRREYVEEVYPLAQQAMGAYKPPEKKEEEP